VNRGLLHLAAVALKPAAATSLTFAHFSQWTFELFVARRTRRRESPSDWNRYKIGKPNESSSVSSDIRVDGINAKAQSRKVGILK